MKTLVPLPRLRGSSVLAGLAAVALLAAPALAQDTPAAPAEAPVAVGANLNISPKRLTFDRSKKSATVYIFNQGTTPATFDISLVDRVMLPSGQISPVSELEGKAEYAEITGKLQSAKPMLVATPRRATLAPGKGQTIRIRVNPGAEAALADGEYRTHLTVTTIPPRDIGLTADEASKPDSQELKFQIVSVFGISIPVIVRTGQTDVRAAISNAAVSYADVEGKRTAVLNFDLARVGASSLFGNVEVRGKGKDLLGVARGVGVYPEIASRQMSIPLTRLPAAGEELTISFSDDDTSPGRVLAQSALVAP